MNGILSSAPRSPTKPESSPIIESYPIDAATLLRVTRSSADSSSEVMLNGRPNVSRNPRCLRGRQRQTLPLLTRYVGILRRSSEEQSPPRRENRVGRQSVFPSPSQRSLL